MDHPEIFATWPTVYAVKNHYVIIVPVKRSTVMWVRIGENEYYDDSNGVLKSASLTHKMEVPGDELNSAREYTVCWREVFDRKPYFAELGDVETSTFRFKPLREDKKEINIYHIADAHNRVSGPVAAGKFFGDNLDLLVLNGDIPNHSGDIANFTAIHEIAGLITHGELPVIFSRGNHDARGIYAECLPDHTPTDEGRSYFTVRIGSIWAVILDCAEDKRDTNEEYGHTICCHDFRLRETRFLKAVADNADNEYNAEGVKHKIVIVHYPFTETHKPPFDIEQDTYSEWCRILREKIKPEIMICGHNHACYITMPGDPLDHKGQPCPVVIASRISKDMNFFQGGAISLYDDRIEVKFTDNEGNVNGNKVINI